MDKEQERQALARLKAVLQDSISLMQSWRRRQFNPQLSHLHGCDQSARGTRKLSVNNDAVKGCVAAYGFIIEAAEQYPDCVVDFNRAEAVVNEIVQALYAAGFRMTDKGRLIRVGE